MLGMKAMIVKEFRELLRDRRTLGMLVALPLLLLVIFGYAANFEADIIGSTTAVAVRTGDWARAFAALAAAGAPVMLAGRAIRVANADPAGLAEVLGAAGIEASLQRVPATIEERMLMLSRRVRAS